MSNFGINSKSEGRLFLFTLILNQCVVRVKSRKPVEITTKKLRMEFLMWFLSTLPRLRSSSVL